jgi:hypothetical protein
MSIRITCIKKSGGYHADPHHAISELGWINEQTRETGTSTRLVVYRLDQESEWCGVRARFKGEPGSGRCAGTRKRRQIRPNICRSSLDR